MFRLIYKTLIEKQRSIILDLNIQNVRYLQTLPYLSSISKPTKTNQQSLTVSFLTNSCGMSLEKAMSASKLINIQNTEIPNSVIQLLTSNGFTKSQIATLISKNPPLLLADPEKSLKPKFEYFESVGISGQDLPMFLCSNKEILRSSLKSHIIPTFDFIRGFVHTNENLVYALKRCTRVIRCNIEKVLVPNINTLRAHGVPEPLIAKLIILHISTLVKRADLFRSVVDVIKEMGFEPRSNMFILALKSMSVLSKATWENKRDTLMSFGWSEDEFHLAFKKNPMFVTSSSKKIRKLMHFFVNKAGLEPSDIVRCPNLFLASLEKKILPRWLVLEVLMTKKLLKKDVDVISALNVSKQNFEKRFVSSYVDDHEVTTAYQGGLGVQAVSADFKICLGGVGAELPQT